MVVDSRISRGVAYAKAVLVTPTIGSFVIGLAVLAAGGTWLVRARSGERDVVRVAAPVVKMNATMPKAAKSSPVLQQRVMKSSVTARLRTASFVRTPEPVFERAELKEISLLEPVQRFDGMTAQEMMRHISVHSMIAATMPYVPFHYGVDYPLPQLMMRMFANSQLPARVRAGRYVVIEQTARVPALNTRLPYLNNSGRSMLWVDVESGLGVGAFFFRPTNGEPTPTLTIFSKQVSGTDVAMRELPVEFVEELKRWEAASGVPAVTVRYFVNSAGRKTVLAHDEDFCARLEAREGCRKMNADAVDVDAAARSFLGQAHYASNATGREARPVE